MTVRGAPGSAPSSAAQRGRGFSAGPSPRAPRPTPAERFWAKVDRRGPDDCWPWTACLNSTGHGCFWFGDRHGPVHRFAYELLVGPIPDGLQIDHLCRVRHCVNPAHMETVSSRENTLRGTGPTATNAVKTHCPRGHPYEGENLYVDRRGCRSCRACAQERHRLAGPADEARRKQRHLAHQQGTVTSAVPCAPSRTEMSEAGSDSSRSEPS